MLDLPTGLGKTTSVVCWAKAMVECGAGWSLAICASRVEELCDIYSALISGPSAIPEERLGLWHSLADPKLRLSTFPRGHEQLDGTRQVLLLTHQRVRLGERISDLLRYNGCPRDLVVYDESQLCTEVRQADYGSLVGELKKARAKIGPETAIGRVLGRREARLDEEVCHEEQSLKAILVELGSESGEPAEDTPETVRRTLGPDAGLLRFR